MPRGVLLTCVLASFAWGCTQDFSIFDPKPGDGGNAGDAGDAGQDAGQDVVVVCNLPSGCQSDAGACGTNCTNTYNTCVTNCGNNQGCKAQCKNTETNCYVSCQSDCENCSGQGSICASQCQSAVGF